MSSTAYNFIYTVLLSQCTVKHYYTTGYWCLPAEDWLHPALTTWVPLGDVQDHGDVLVRLAYKVPQMPLCKICPDFCIYPFHSIILSNLQVFWSPQPPIIWGHWGTTEEGWLRPSKNSQHYSNLRWDLLCLTNWMTIGKSISIILYTLN